MSTTARDLGASLVRDPAPAAVPAAARRLPQWRRAGGALLTVVTLAALACWFVLLRPQSLGGGAQYTVIHGNSMWPLYRDGDLIVTQRQPAYTVGEIVAYHVPRGEIGAGDVVIHRIVGGTAATGFVLRGDNNPSVDPWHPKLADVVGTAWVQIPRAGRVLVLLHQPLALALVVSVPVFILLLRRRPKERAAPSAS